MESVISSATDKKSIFRKSVPETIQAFEVSCDSTSIDISDLDSTTTNKIDPFKVPKKVIPKSFDLSLNESVNDSESEKTITSTKTLFKNKKNKCATDLFHVSYNETNGEITSNDSSVTFNTSSTGKGTNTKSNPFKKKKKSSIEEPEIHISLVEKNSEDSVTEEITENGNISKLNKNVEKSDSNLDSDGDTSNFVIKPNPFKKSIRSKNDSLNGSNLISVRNSLKSSKNEKSRMEMSTKDVEKSVRDEISIFNSGNSFDHENVSSNKDGDKDTSNTIVKSNPFKKSIKSKNDSIPQAIHVSYMEEEEPEKSFSFIKSVDGNKTNPFKKTIKSKNSSSLGKELQATYQEEDSEKSLTTKTINRDNFEESEKNIPFANHSLSEKASDVGIHLDQSSFNDDNLNNWTCDYSDEEMNLPTVPPVLTNTSTTLNKVKELSAIQSKENISVSWEEKFKHIISQPKKINDVKKTKETQPVKPAEKPKQKPVTELNVYKTPKLIKPANFITKKLYQHIINKLKPKFGIDTYLKAEELVLSICKTVNTVTRKKAHQKKVIQNLKKEMAQLEIIETTVDFYEFVIKYLPHKFRLKVVPCVQPVTNAVVPPKDVANPFNKILN